jgi:C4-dicarboxylate-specific signal transduction histidine kinase
VLETGAAAVQESRDGPNATARAKRFGMLTVRDTGSALPPSAQAGFFEPYFSADEGAGLGLALAVVEGIVAQSGGRVRVCSGGERGGASYELLLPAAPSHPAGGIEAR